jgi:hypothetical protein
MKPQPWGERGGGKGGINSCFNRHTNSVGADEAMGSGVDGEHGDSDSTTLEATSKADVDDGMGVDKCICLSA